MKFKDKLMSVLLLILSLFEAYADHISETLLGAVVGGNYSYYRLTQTGSIILHLNSLQGDADLYVSTGNIKPTFDIDNHDWQSTTCGVEQVRVPSSYERPLSIAVYGHPSHEISLYELKIDVYESEFDEEDMYDDVSYQNVDTPNYRPTPSPRFPVKEELEHEEKSVFWSQNRVHCVAKHS